jgi:Glycine transporter
MRVSALVLVLASQCCCSTVYAAKAQPAAVLRQPIVLHEDRQPLNAHAAAAVERFPKATNRRDVTVGETMTRYPSLRSSGGLLRSLDYLGTVAFAMGGAIAASQRGMDLLGAVELGVITAMGGGTTRDLLLGQTPV